MIVANRTLIDEYVKRHTDALHPLATWLQVVHQAEWKTNHDIKQRFGTASFLHENMVVFNIKGNNYRLVVLVVYQHSVVYIRFVGTHEEYDRIDVATI